MNLCSVSWWIMFETRGGWLPGKVLAQSASSTAVSNEGGGSSKRGVGAGNGSIASLVSVASALEACRVVVMCTRMRGCNGLDNPTQQLVRGLLSEIGNGATTAARNRTQAA
jgi:hypothetical protein